MSEATPEATVERSASGTTSPAITWDFGTAYDLFVSLEVLHRPAEYGLRASWAAGVRSRLPSHERRFLEEVLEFHWVPIHWVYTLPKPKDANCAIWSLRQIPVAQRLELLGISYEMPGQVAEVLREVAQRRSWAEEHLKVLREGFEHKTEVLKNLTSMLDWWSRPDEFGELYLSSLQSYYEVFFAEEEKRIGAVLKRGLERAQELAARLSLDELLTELSQGVHFEEEFRVKELILAPAFWNTPIVFFARLSDDRQLLLFGARPAEMALIPGETVPEAMLRSLKAAADPTRLKILRYLSKEPLTLTQLSRRLRLRAPTVTHHLRELRLAGLVHLILGGHDVRLYAARLEAVDATFANLKKFLEGGDEEED